MPSRQRVRVLVQLDGGEPIEVEDTAVFVERTGEVMAARDPGPGRTATWRNIGSVDVVALNTPPRDDAVSA